MSTTPKISTIGFYNHDASLFDLMTIPEGIDRETLINTILIECGEFPVLYTNFDFMKFAIGTWSKKNYHSFERIYMAFTADYNPIHNFDRNEVYTDKENVKRDGSHTQSETNNASGTTEMNSTDSSEVTKTESANGKTENKVAAYNSSTYQPDTNSSTTTSGNTDEERSGRINQNGRNSSQNTLNASGSDSDNTDRDFIHEGHLYGNIGVTKSQDMVLDEINLRMNNLYSIISEMYKSELCLLIY